jgi:hypothetical protein
MHCGASHTSTQSHSRYVRGRMLLDRVPLTRTLRSHDTQHPIPFTPVAHACGRATLGVAHARLRARTNIGVLPRMHGNAAPLRVVLRTLRAALLFVHSLTATYTVLVASLRAVLRTPVAAATGATRESHRSHTPAGGHASPAGESFGLRAYASSHACGRFSTIPHSGHRSPAPKNTCPSLPTQSPRKFKITIYTYIPLSISAYTNTPGTYLFLGAL